MRPKKESHMQEGKKATDEGRNLILEMCPSAILSLVGFARKRETNINNVKPLYEEDSQQQKIREKGSETKPVFSRILRRWHQRDKNQEESSDESHILRKDLEETFPEEKDVQPDRSHSILSRNDRRREEKHRQANALPKTREGSSGMGKGCFSSTK